MIEVEKFRRYLERHAGVSEESARRYAEVFKKILLKENLRSSDKELEVTVRVYMQSYRHWKSQNQKEKKLSEFFEI